MVNIYWYSKNQVDRIVDLKNKGRNVGRNGQFPQPGL